MLFRSISIPYSCKNRPLPFYTTATETELSFVSREVPLQGNPVIGHELCHFTPLLSRCQNSNHSTSFLYRFPLDFCNFFQLLNHSLHQLQTSINVSKLPAAKLHAYNYLVLISEKLTCPVQLHLDIMGIRSRTNTNFFELCLMLMEKGVRERESEQMECTWGVICDVYKLFYMYPLFLPFPPPLFFPFFCFIFLFSVVL